MEKVEIYHHPKITILPYNIFGIMYAGSIKEPNVFVVKDIEDRSDDIEFTDKEGKIKFSLEGCVYKQHGIYLHVECRHWKIEYIDE